MESNSQEKNGLFNQADPAWASAHKQAANIPAIKDRRTRRQQIALLCETWKRALKGSK